MKKILVLTSMFPEEMKKTYNDFIKINDKEGSPFRVLSPISLTNELENKYFQTVAIALQITTLILEYQDPKHPLVYIGPATKGIKYNEIYTIDKEAIQRQEKFIDSLAIEANLKETFDSFYKTEEATEDFKNIQEVFDHLRKEV